MAESVALGAEAGPDDIEDQAHDGEGYVKLDNYFLCRASAFSLIILNSFFRIMKQVYCLCQKNWTNMARRCFYKIVFVLDRFRSVFYV